MTTLRLIGDRSLEILNEAASWYGPNAGLVAPELVEELRRRAHINWPDRRVRAPEFIEVAPYRHD